ncbi:MAG: hypothetical protein E6I65_07970 [Chloroflexi bacterium]|nr:MAG: hypothetical protein E6I65_07970 [Chloroflexota bacterium]
MIEVYVDVAAASVEAGGTEAGNQLAAEPQAVRALRYLADAGIRVVLVTGGSGEPPAELRGAASEVVATVPVRPRGPAWYLTSDIARCQGASARLRTVLIGGTPPTGSVRRCDAVARDLQAAAMEILAAVAMPAGTEDRVTP